MGDALGTSPFGAVQMGGLLFLILPAPPPPPVPYSDNPSTFRIDFIPEALKRRYQSAG